MRKGLTSAGFLASFFLVVMAAALSYGTDGKQWSPSGEPPSADSLLARPESTRKADVRIEAVVVNPYRSANVGSQVGGSIDRVHFDEGDFIKEGELVVEIDPKRYQLIADRAEERLKGLEVALKRAEEEVRLKGELLGLDATTRQELLKARAEMEVAQARVGEARRELDLAKYDLQCCKIKAPFAGYVAVRYKQPDETVERLEKVFALVDSSKVHAVANVPEILISEFPKGTKAAFTYSPEKRFSGTVDRIGKLIDPKSRTKRVYLLIDNSSGQLEVGMTGSLELVK
jgi:RND family efflux transporter MFP subunit